MVAVVPVLSHGSSASSALVSMHAKSKALACFAGSLALAAGAAKVFCGGSAEGNPQKEQSNQGTNQRTRDLVDDPAMVKMNGDAAKVDDAPSSIGSSSSSLHSVTSAAEESVAGVGFGSDGEAPPATTSVQKPGPSAAVAGMAAFLELPRWLEVHVAFETGGKSDLEYQQQPPASASLRQIALREDILWVCRSGVSADQVRSVSPRMPQSQLNGDTRSWQEECVETLVVVSEAQVRMSGSMVAIVPRASPATPSVGIWFRDNETAGCWAAALCASSARCKGLSQATTASPAGTGLPQETLTKYSHMLKDLKASRQKMNDKVVAVVGAGEERQAVQLSVKQRQKQLDALQNHRKRLQDHVDRVTTAPNTPRCSTPVRTRDLAVDAAETPASAEQDLPATVAAKNQVSSRRELPDTRPSTPPIMTAANLVANDLSPLSLSENWSPAQPTDSSVLLTVTDRGRTPSMGDVLQPIDAGFSDFAAQQLLLQYVESPNALSPPASVRGESPPSRAVPARAVPLATALDELLGDRGTSRSTRGLRDYKSTGHRPQRPGPTAANQAFALRLQEQLEKRRPSLEQESRRVMKQLEDAEVLAKALKDLKRSP